MALVDVHRQPETGKARQFDGTLDAMLDIIGGRPLGQTTVICGFDDDGAFSTLRVSGPVHGEYELCVGDWAVFPTDASKPGFAVPADQAGVEWSG